MRLSAVVFLFLCCVGVTAQAEIFGSGPNQFEMEFVRIGNAGNPPDETGIPSPAGAVDYVYHLGRTEVSREMVEKANAAGDLEITLADMSNFGGNGLDRPATGVSWNEAARFVNWLNVSQGFPAAYKFGAQPGDLGYDAEANIQTWGPDEAGFDESNPFRNRQSRYFLPTTDEWYKAAYFDPSANNGVGGYWDYATGDDSQPIPVAAGVDANSAVYSQLFRDGPADVTQAGGLSPYGVMGLGGNVWEWEETELDLTNDSPSALRGYRGGNWAGDSDDLEIRFGGEPWTANIDRGFRIVQVPEPSSSGVFLYGLFVGLAIHRNSRRRLSR